MPQPVRAVVAAIAPAPASRARRWGDEGRFPRRFIALVYGPGGGKGREPRVMGGRGIERGDEDPRRTGFPRPLAKSGLDLAIEVRTLASASAGRSPGDGRLYPVALLVSGVPRGRAPRRPSIPIRFPWRSPPAEAFGDAPWALILPPAR